jgi:hypothetical protein
MGSSNGHDKSLSELEREAERNRAELMHTVDALQHRVSPQALKADVKDYVRHTSHDFLDSVQQRARENPLQTVAIAAGLAFPLWRLVASMPVPLLLIGAGLALSKASSHAGDADQPPHGGSLGNELYGQARSAVAQARAKVGEAVSGVQDRVHGAITGVQERVQDATGAMQQKAGDMAEQSGRMTERMTSGVQEVKEAASERIGSAAAAASDIAAKAASIPSELYGRGVDAAQSGMHAAYRGAEQVRHAAYQGADRMREAGRSAQNSLINSIEQHPFMVAALGLAAGAAVAAAFPATRVEGRLFGETSDRLKERASELASEGADLAWSAANGAYEQAVQEARAQGLTPEALQQAIKDLAQKAKSAAEQSVGATR